MNETLSVDLVVYGGTPGGIACAVRAAREGLRVVMVSYYAHLGGALINGVSLWDTFYDGARSPVFDQVKGAIQEHYRDTYGEGSPQHLAAMPGNRLHDHATGSFEPSVAEAVFESLLRGEANLTVLRGWELKEARKADRVVESARFVKRDGSAERWLAASTFVDASYEGDLMAMAGASFRVGREGREEYGEAYAGKLFARKTWARVDALIDGSKTYHNTSPREAFEGKLNLRTWMLPTSAILPGSTGEADGAVQAYNFRLALSRNPANRRMVERPEGYDPAQFAHLPKTMRVHAIALINDTCGWNGGRPIGWNFDYPKADWFTRQDILRRYREFAVGALYFLQHDESVDPAARAYNQQWGLARDQFIDNDNLPYECYVREARRMVGRYVLRESDGLIAPEQERAPVHLDSVGFTEWPMDSVQCLPEVIKDVDGSDVHEGAFFLSEESRPATVPYRSLLPRELDNLLVPVCLSCTHVFWGAARLEPVWMQTGEAAGFAAALAFRQGIAPAALDPRQLVRTLVEHRCMVAFFNDVDVANDEPWVPAVQYLATLGFFDSYDARPHEPLGAAAGDWSERWRNISSTATGLDSAWSRADAAVIIYRNITQTRAHGSI